MVRKIPVKKNRGKIKDPLLILARREADSSVNSAPKDPRDQEIPKSILEIKRLCEQVKSGKFKRGKKKKSKLLDTNRIIGLDPKLPGMKRPDKAIPRIVQMPGESEEKFFQRFAAVTQDVLIEATIEDKFAVQINKDEEGQITSYERDSTEPEKMEIKKKFKKKRIKGKKSKGGEEPKKNLNSHQRAKIRRRILKGPEQESNEIIDFSQFKDEIKFGEVVHRPPQFTSIPKGSQPNSRPGGKNLLLKNILNEKEDRKRKSSVTPSMEVERLKAVAAYRALKAKKV